MVSGRFFLMLLAIFVLVALVTYFLHRIFRNKYIKYIPAVLFLAVSLYSVYLSRMPSTGFQDLARIITAMMFFSGFLAGIATGLFVDLVLPRIRKSK